ncbi:hypothetical protein EVG20_g6619 [Dentipellis fragilis]|uniref:G-protein coupled receptors family 1 profile domain-containing protein n=1 Tax=Dentipellis fragilis TaxID=205917 RepID=A0A4Y9YM31_9AGAM|nr:hypothetical protein EVG20_g6619 [Dentipellis fragilis]
MASAEIALERASYIGNAVGIVLYGFQILMYSQSVTFLLAEGSSHRKMHRFFVVYGGVLLVLLTVVVVKNLVFGEEAWIEHRAEMDPAVFIADHTSAWWYNTLGSVAVVITNFMSDGLLLYRTYIIWGSRPRVIVLPAFMFLAALAMAMAYTVDSSLPGSSPYTRRSVQFAIAWVSLSASVNVILTSLISVRLLMMRNVVRSILPAQVGAKYTSIVAIFVESALPLSLLSIGLIIVYAIGSPAELAVAFVWAVFCVCPVIGFSAFRSGLIVIECQATSPQLIILRVAMGLGWSKEVVSQVTHPMGSGIHFVIPPSADTANAQSPSSTLCPSARGSKLYPKRMSVMELQEA